MQLWKDNLKPKDATTWTLHLRTPTSRRTAPLPSGRAGPSSQHTSALRVTTRCSAPFHPAPSDRPRCLAPPTPERRHHTHFAVIMDQWIHSFEIFHSSSLSRSFIMVPTIDAYNHALVLKLNRLQKFARSGRGNLPLDKLDHIQRESADRHNDGHLPSKPHRYDKREVCGGPYVQRRPSFGGE